MSIYFMSTHANWETNGRKIKEKLKSQQLKATLSETVDIIILERSLVSPTTNVSIMLSYIIQYPASYHLSGFHVLSSSYLPPVNLQELHIFLNSREQFSLQFRIMLCVYFFLSLIHENIFLECFVVVRIMTHHCCTPTKDVHVLIPGKCESYFTWQDLVDVIMLRILRRKHHSGLSGSVQCIIKGPYKRDQESQNQRGIRENTIMLEHGTNRPKREGSL